MRTFLLLVHVASAIALIGPTTFATSSFARHARAGDIDAMRLARRTTRACGFASVVVAVVGIALAARIDVFDELWVQLALTLFVVGIVLIALVHLPAQRDAIDAAEEGRPLPGSLVLRLRASSATYAVSWVVIVWLMVAKPA